MLDSQLFNLKGKFSLSKNSETDKFESKETEIVETLDQYLPLNDLNYKIVIGFILTKEQYEYINK